MLFAKDIARAHKPPKIIRLNKISETASEPFFAGADRAASA